MAHHLRKVPGALLALDGVGMTFGGVAALRNITYEVPQGIIQAVIGPNGAGKTTLFNCISGLLKPTAGRVAFQGRVISGLPPHEVARLGISRTFQHVALFLGMSVLENVMVGRHVRTGSGFLSAGLRLPSMRREERAIRERATEVLAMVGLADSASLPAGALPLGRQKMLEIARALATDPSLLMLDEPAGGLNARETEDLGDLIRRIRDSGVTVLLVEHDMNLVMDVSERVFVLNFGQALASGTPSEVKDHPEVVAAYLGEAADAPVVEKHAHR